MRAAILGIVLSAFSQFSVAQSKMVAIDTTIIINIGGIQQVIQLKGKDTTKPLLFYLHGAGGNDFSLIANGDKMTSKLQEHFIVALWDQRDYGKTFEINKSTKPLTVKLIVDDTKEIIDFLLKKFCRQKLYLAGHSMGSVEGIYIANKYPELLYAVIAISPAVNGIQSQKMGLLMLQQHFKKANNQRAVRELATIRLPARDFESLFIRYIWQTEYDGEHISDSVKAQIKPMMKKWMESSAALLSNEIFEINFFKQFPLLKCAAYFFVGRKDFMTNATLSEQYYKKLKAPRKQLFWFEKSAHGIPDTEPELMQDIIINKVLTVSQNQN
jgi:pimeloyl-ACP methyl ester carboxylesterase